MLWLGSFSRALAKALNLPFAHYTIAVSVSGAGHHPLGESSATSLTTLDAGFTSGLGCVARAVDIGRRRRRGRYGSAGGTGCAVGAATSRNHQDGRIGAGVEHFAKSGTL